MIVPSKANVVVFLMKKIQQVNYPYYQGSANWGLQIQSSSLPIFVWQANGFYFKMVGAGERNSKEEHTYDAQE